MNKRKFLVFMSVVLAVAALTWGVDQGSAQTPYQLKLQDGWDRVLKGMEQRHKLDPKFPAKMPEYEIPVTPQVFGTVGYNGSVNYDLPNYAYSPNIRKFVDTVPGLGIANVNTFGQYIPVAIPDKSTYPGSDYYELSLNYYTERLHRDLPAPGTKLRGYAQTNATGHVDVQNVNQYLGPLIVAKRGTPVRLKFKNNLPVSGSGLPGELLPFPVDTSVMGAGTGPLGGLENYTENRTTIHLHGGLTPWISDGTPHQWITPALDLTSYRKGASFQNVPDMVNGTVMNGFPIPCLAAAPNPNPGACFAPALGDGLATFYYTNQQSGRLMFYHDHAYGITRLNVYDGVAAGYLLYDQVEQDLIEQTNTSGIWTKIGINPITFGKGIIPNPFPGTIGTGNVYEFGIPLVIQDRTFVNDAFTPPGAGFTGTPTPLTSAVDPLWDTYMGLKGFPTTGGDFWLPHEYMPNEDIYRSSGFNVLGRWDYGPWMAPPLPAKNLNLPSPTITPEAMMDTMLVNGHPYPYVTAPQTALRFRILSASNDRMLNLQLYYAVDSVTGVVCKAGNTFTPANCTETKMVPANRPKNPNNPNPPTLPICVDPPAPGHIDSVTGLPFNTIAGDCTPVTWPTDGRVGGVPDPSTAGPKWIQIGNEGGILPHVAEIPANPVNYEYNRRAVTVLDVTDKSLWLAPAERADVIVDFSQIPAGSYLILYNDAGAPTPLYDPRTDIFVGQDDQTAIGGAPAITPGFGPNTRTIMQIRVVAGPAVVFDLATLKTALPKAYGMTQKPPIVPQVAYNDAFGTSYTDTYAGVLTESLNLSGAATSVGKVVNAGPGLGYTVNPAIVFAGGGGSGATASACLNGVTAVTVTAAGSGYTSPPTVQFTNAPLDVGTGVSAVSTIQGGVVTGVFIVNPGCNYLVAPTVALNGGGGTLATATAAVTPGSVGTITLGSGGSGYTTAPLVYVVSNNGLGAGALANAMLTGDAALGQVNLTEGFDIWFGRAAVSLGTTPVPLLPLAPVPAVPGLAAYIDPPSDFLNVNQPMFWRVSHIGVDSHPMHWHIVNVQVINRVDWTNSILPPDPNELGWKETIRTIPFTDLIVAFKPELMKLPFPLPVSKRLLDVTTIAGSTANFAPVAPAPGAPAAATITNVTTNFGWEYVWHCHILSHEENDMMRPLVVIPAYNKLGTFMGGSWNLQKPYPTANFMGSFGLPGDIAVTGDWTGDGTLKIGVFRVVGGIGRFYLDWNGNGVWEGPGVDKAYNFGIAGDVPVVGDWNGDGRSKIGVFRVVAGAGKFYLDWNGNGVWEGSVTDKLYTFGIAGDKPVTGDWNGNGITKIGVSRASGANRIWLLDLNGNGVWEGAVTDRQYSFGLATDIPVTGDWSGSGNDKVGVFRAGQWLVDLNGNGAWNGTAGGDAQYAFGVAGNQPVTGKW